jgi:hypothetical protein
MTVEGAPRRKSLIVEVGGGMLLYLLATAAVAGLGGVLRILHPTSVAWMLGTLVLFGYFIRAFARRGAFRESLVGLLAMIAAVVLTGLSALFGLTVLVNIWEGLGIPH